ncbi:MAG: threonine synthase, partial [Gammaproteobacteria bacterium]
TRNDKSKTTLSQAILSGLADDGGLFIPSTFPKINASEFDASEPFAAFAQRLLAPYFDNDPLSNHLAAHCQQAFNFPVPLKALTENTFIMELFHGPTLSFKDFGARFLGECLNQLATDKKITILVATSGDTGSAVASALYQKPNINVVILYPKGKVSPSQEHQLTCWDDNVLALKVKGNFDDCQHIVKALFAQGDNQFSSANSINIGRLLPQMSYYAYCSTQIFQQQGIKPGFIVPSGNLGNVTAAFWAKTMGFPIGDIVLATNANQVLSDYLKTGDYQPRASIATLANAMDVGKPSNFERLQHLYRDFDEFKAHISAFSIGDDAIKRAIADCYQNTGKIICPHTATAYAVRQQLPDQPWVIAATAHPCKFASIIEPIIGRPVPMAAQLKDLLSRDTHAIEVAADVDQVAARISKLS